MGAVQRAFPVALAELENGAKGQRHGCEFQVVCRMIEGGTGHLTLTGYATGEAIVSSIRCAIAWARLHHREISQAFGAEEPEGRIALMVDVGRRDLDYYVELSNEEQKKFGSSVGGRG